ncbi:MAG: MOSC domain-containing protein, partial [Gammaproteobacteria bacterium]|nr:MOSC domain-containing protein [Gammaproteobacteria bacterium]
INTQMTKEQVIVSFPDMEPLTLPLRLDNGQDIQVTVWKDNCMALEAGDEINQWFSHALGQDLRLVYMPDTTERRVDPDYGQESDITSFSDGFPLLLISEASLDDLNDRLEQPLNMRRFRPNLVVRGCPAYAEDSWKRIRIGDIEFDIVKSCSRCIVTTINPDTGERSTDSEPLRTLSLYRRKGNKVYFGQNLIHRGTGKLQIGASIEVLEQA